MTLFLKDLTFSYEGEGLPIFKGFSLSVEGPGFFSIFGFSGSGKTTLGKLIAGMLKPQSGVIKTRPRGALILYSHNEERFPNWEPCISHLNSVTSPGTQNILELFTDMALKGVDLSVRFSHLSLGQKNRVNLARYIVQDFDALIIDEGLSNVDEPTRERILLFLKTHFPKKTFIYISHHVVEVARFSKCVFVLKPRGDHPTARIHAVTGLDETEKRRAQHTDLRERGLEILSHASLHTDNYHGTF